MKVIIDAANVAHFEKGEGQPKLSNILIAIETLKKRGYASKDIIAIADASLKYDIDEREEYLDLIANDVIDEVPTGISADITILHQAEELDAHILSNDFFREYRDEFEDIPKRRLPFQFKNEEFQIGKSSKPKRVKNILQRISTDSLMEFDHKRFDVYRSKKGNEISGIAIARESIDRIQKNDIDSDGVIGGFISKIPLFDKIMTLVEDIESVTAYVIFVLVHPKDYKVTVKNAGSISVTVCEKLGLEQNPLVAVRNDLYVKPGFFELNILFSDDVLDTPPYNVIINVNESDYPFIKKNSRNIASTVAGRIGSWKFPIVAVRKDIMLKPGEYNISLEKHIE